ncbi:hypothetical protein FCIRC_99 [Fusarium circinatum]|uniref:Uncharacterized protein n=1 Tax=Fusarium circinatum TaxID=48490 RepID=A0A8H5XEI9_FUSCI|nr:hypothetical protein FCIRC_99 [Fusarium circinatum]
MSNAQDKRAAEPHEDEPAKKRGRPSKAVLNSKVPENSMSRVQVRTMLLRHPELQYSSQDESSFYEDLIPWPEQYEWSDEDVALVEEEWKNSEIRECSGNLNTSQYASLFLLFKISLRLYRTTPTILLSPVCALRYQPISKVAKKWIPSAGFCETLASIMVHPCWKENIDSLALALRWAVICRLDSRSAWATTVVPYCRVLQRTLENVKGYGSRSLDTSYHEMHKAERERASERGERLSSLSDILYELGEAVPKETKKPKAVAEYDHVFGWSVLPVTQWDLDVLGKVVDSMDFKPQWNYSVKDALIAWKTENSGRPEKPSQDKLSLIYALTHKSIFKFIRLLLRQLTPTQGTEESDDNESQSTDLPSDDDRSQVEASSSHRENRRLTVFDDSSDEEYVGLRRNTGRLPLIRHRCDANDAEEEGTSPVLPEEHEPYPLQGVESEEGDRGGMTNTFDDSVGPDFGELDLQNTNESPEFRPHGPTLAESFPSERHASPVYASLREKKMLSELSELRKENKELRDGQKQLQDLFTEGQKEQKQLVLDMKQQLDNMQSELTQLRQARQAPGDVVQSHPERPSLPEATVIASRSPELGTHQSPPPLDDFTLSEEVADDRPMEEDIASEQPVPKQKTPEPERSEQPAPTAQKQTTEPDSNINPAGGDEDGTQAVSQLPGTIAETSSTNVETRASEQSSAPLPWPVLPLNPPMPRRNIPRLAWTGAGRFPATSDAHDVFVTPRSKVLKVLKGYE